MKFALLSLLLFGISSVSQAAIVCDDATINSEYLEKVREYAEWDDDALRPYAANLCRLEQQRELAAIQIRDKAQNIRDERWQVCSDLGVTDGEPGEVTPACKKAHVDRINKLIDNCREVMNLGHNPHNIGIIMDETLIEVACLKGIAQALQESN